MYFGAEKHNIFFGNQNIVKFKKLNYEANFCLFLSHFRKEICDINELYCNLKKFMNMQFKFAAMVIRKKNFGT